MDAKLTEGGYYCRVKIDIQSGQFSHICGEETGSQVARRLPFENGSKRDMAKIKSILWQGIFLPGHEACRLFSQDSRWHLEGTAVFAHEQRPCCLEYQVVCDEVWRTQSAKVEGWLGSASINIQINIDPARHWWLRSRAIITSVFLAGIGGLMLRQAQHRLLPQYMEAPSGLSRL